MTKEFNRLFLILFLSLVSISVFGQTDTFNKNTESILKKAQTDSTLHNVIQPDNIILNNKAEAIKFAEKILFSVYGKKEIRRQKPYNVKYENYHWIINGTLRKGWIGGTFLIIIDSRDYRIVRITHGK